MPVNNANNLVRSPISFHDASQVAGTPFHADDRFVIKFHNFWTIESPPGYSLLFTHPVNRADLPFTTLTGLVDTDAYRDVNVHFPAHWHDLAFNGVLPKGTPVAQCIPVKRESWAASFGTLSHEQAARMRELSKAMQKEERHLSPRIPRRQTLITLHLFCRPSMRVRHRSAAAKSGRGRHTPAP